MKKFILCLLVILFGFAFISCTETSNSGDNGDSEKEEPNDGEKNETTTDSKTLVVYFSKTNTTKTYALELKELLKTDIFEIRRKEDYPESYQETIEIAKTEKNDNARPELKEYMSKDNMSKYETIYLGFPIWYATVPMPVLTFLEYYDLQDKTIYTFCTSGGSGISGSTSDIKKSSSGANVIEGVRLRSIEELNKWISSLK